MNVFKNESQVANRRIMKIVVYFLCFKFKINEQSDIQ